MVLAVTKYKYIGFSRYYSETGPYYKCRNRKGELLGYVNYYARWKEWEFCPEPHIGLTIQCLTDIADFIGKLNSFSKAVNKIQKDSRDGTTKTTADNN